METRDLKHSGQKSGDTRSPFKSLDSPLSELDNDDRRAPETHGKGMALALILASQVRNIINPETARFTTFEAIEYLNSRKILTFDLQEALRILIQQRILKQAYESIVEGEGKDVSFTKRLLKLARICRVCYFVED